MSKRRFGRYTVETSNEEKLFFPDEKISKGDLIDYYQKIAEKLVPCVKERPLVMKRYPDGIKGESFFQKEIGDYFPDWIERVKVKKKGGTVTHVQCDNAATLVYLANQACIELHPWLSRSDKLHYPDQLIIDLDPSGDDFSQAVFGARVLKELFDELDLKAFLKTTGSRGLHVLVPLDRRANFDKVREFAQDTAKLLAQRHSDKLTIEARKAKRRGRLLIDTARNAYAQTAVAPYAVRAKPGAPVATPLDWDELGNKKLNSQSYNVRNIFRRLGRKTDPWKDLPRLGRSLKEARRRLDAILEK
ncbi:MAG: ATP-dependent DNA ligase [Acidobacteria bacterium]|nr:MAG: ATP-dependent DNA ligase [Acidobacteriota bacterium]